MIDIPNEVLRKIDLMLNTGDTFFPEPLPSAQSPIKVAGMQVSFQRMGSEYWKTQYKSRFSKRGNQADLKKVYDEIQREIDLARNVHQTIYNELTRNRPDPTLRSRIMAPVEERRGALIDAFDEVLASSKVRNIQLSVDGQLRALQIKTNWFLPRLWHAITDPILESFFLVPFFLGLALAVLWFIQMGLSLSSETKVYSEKLLALGQAIAAYAGPLWWLKIPFYLVIPYYVQKAIRAFLNYELPPR